MKKKIYSLNGNYYLGTAFEISEHSICVELDKKIINKKIVLSNGCPEDILGWHRNDQDGRLFWNFNKLDVVVKGTHIMSSE